MMDRLHLKSEAGELVFAPMPGNIVSLRFRGDGRELDVLHRAPWADDDDPGVPGLAPVERHLSGDFFCAPFGPSDVEEAPPHGWTANSEWEPLAEGEGLNLALLRPVLGARIEKSLVLAAEAPVLYQEHRIVGGKGQLPVAHHAMVRARAGGTLALSNKRLALTPEQPLEPGRAALTYPAASGDLHAFPGTDGPVDICALPIGERTEDFVALLEAGQGGLAWTALLREQEDDIVFVLKDPATLPVTMLWHSNAGRDYAPWSGRHTGVLGIEDGCAAGPAGHAAAIAPNPLSETGVRTALVLDPARTHNIRLAIGAVPRPAGWATVTDMALKGDRLIIYGPRGQTREMAFDPNFFSRSA